MLNSLNIEIKLGQVLGWIPLGEKGCVVDPIQQIYEILQLIKYMD
jgi:hypothetical protein